MDLKFKISDLRFRGRAARRGFTFLEILFAVIVFGVGLIMVAGIFPVAIRQTRDNVEDTMGTIVAQDAIRLLQGGASSLVDNPNSGNGIDAMELKVTAPPGQSVVYAYTEAPSLKNGTMLYNRTQGNMVVQNDARYAWVPFFRRERDNSGNQANSAQVFVIAVRVRDKDVYTYPSDVGLIPTFISKGVTTNAGGTLHFNTAPAQAGEGAYVIIANGKASSGLYENGRVYRLGTQVSGSTTDWNLMAPYTITSGATETVSSADAYIVGRPANGGLVQDIGVATGFITIPSK